MIGKTSLLNIRYLALARESKPNHADAVWLAFQVGGAPAAQALRDMFGVTKLSISSTAASSDGSTVRFVVEGTGIESIKVEIYNLGGSLIYDSDFAAGNELAWRVESERGEALANGVHLYVVTGRGFNGVTV